MAALVLGLVSSFGLSPQPQLPPLPPSHATHHITAAQTSTAVDAPTQGHSQVSVQARNTLACSILSAPAGPSTQPPPTPQPASHVGPPSPSPPPPLPSRPVPNPPFFIKPARRPKGTGRSVAAVGSSPTANGGRTAAAAAAATGSTQASASLGTHGAAASGRHAAAAGVLGGGDLAVGAAEGNGCAPASLGVPQSNPIEALSELLFGG